jgi:signal transduction histidine kinase
MADYPLAMVAADDRGHIAEILASARDLTSGESVDVRAVHRNGETRWLSLSWQPMYATSGRYLGFRTSARDVTERHKLREQLRLHAEHLEQLVQERTARLRQLEQRQRQMEKLAALGQLAAGVAHEINNPLAGIRNAFELIKSELSPEDEHFELLDLIDREIERISAIVLQMHQLYRRSPPQPTDFSMAQILGEVISLLESTAKKRHVHLTCELGPVARNVHLAEGEVKQILYNVIRNALQASPENEAVSIRLAQQATEVVVDVQDHGAGIPDDIVSRIFDPFFTTKHGSDQPGMGLGLSVSRSLIEAMGGRIEVFSGAGQGARFSVIFPTRVEGPEAANDE